MVGHRLASWSPHSGRGTPPPWDSMIESALIVAIVLATGTTLSPAAVADSVADLRDAVSLARSETSCKAMQYNPIVEHVASVINRSTNDYLDHTATRVPVSDPLEGLKDLGYRGTKAYLLQGADKNDGNAIKGALLEGYATIPNCSYRDFGVSIRRNDTTGYTLAAVVLAGP